MSCAGDNVGADLVSVPFVSGLFERSVNELRPYVGQYN